MRSYLSILALSVLLCGTSTDARQNKALRNAQFKEKLDKLKLGKAEEWVEPTIVHIVPHSYNGQFLDAIDQYFEEDKDQLKQQHFDKVFNSVVRAMKKDPTRTFSHYEVKHFSNWYMRQNHDVKNLIYEWMQQGNFEIIGGGWEVHEDACPNYADMLTNIYKGHKFLYDQLWYFPRVAWSLDQYGHSSTNARIFAEAGAEALYIRHIDPQEREKRLSEKSMEFLWRPNFQHLGRKAEIFTHVFYDFDASPFDFDVLDPPAANSTQNFEVDKNEWAWYWGNKTDDWWFNEDEYDDDWNKDEDGDEDDWWNDEEFWKDLIDIFKNVTDQLNKTIEDQPQTRMRLLREFQLGQQVRVGTRKLKDFAMEMAQYYNTPHILMMVGSSVNFEDAEDYYHQMDMMIELFNRNHKDIVLTHSTLSFFDEVIEFHAFDHPTSYFDIMPIADSHHNYFSGLYSSRENLKSLIRRGGQQLSAFSKLFTSEILHDDIKQDRVNRILNVTDELQRAVAQAQSVDGVSGVSKKEFADKISKDLTAALQKSKSLSAEIIDAAAQKIAGISLDKGASYQWCLEINNISSYLECPIKDHAKDTKLQMIVAVFNSATANSKVTLVGVPHGNLSVRAYNESSKQFELTNATVICDQTSEVNDCRLYAKHNIEGHGIGFLELKYDSNSNITSQIKQDLTFKIENSVQIIQYKGEDQKLGSQFVIQKKKYINNFHFSFDLRYYPSYQGFQGSRSGAGVFKPAVNDSLKFSKLDKIYYQQGSVVSQITLIYRDSKTNETAEVRARLYDGDSIIKWDVLVGELPRSKQGQEITINFYSPDIKNDGEFFTDSNGLQMENRQLNYRPNYNYIPNQHQNISHNYYPVTSAIAIRDKGFSLYQMTVMTSQTQGGSVIKEGRIELMHSRRLVFDDNYHTGVILSETEPVQATYYLQIFDREFEESHQRRLQLHMDSPLVTYFAFNYKVNSKQIQSNSQPLLNMQELKSVGIPSLAKVEFIPFNRSQIYFRIDNLQDKFDSKLGDKQNVSYIDLNAFANLVYFKLHGKNLTQNQYMWISEMTISGNQEYKWAKYEKVIWQGADDDFIDTSQLPLDKSSTKVSLEPQRIRMFYLEYYYWAGEDWGETDEKYEPQVNKTISFIQ